MSGIKLSSNNEPLRSALDSLKQVLASSLGENGKCSSLFAEMETTIKSIDQKINDLILEPESIVLPATENFAVESPLNLNLSAGVTAQ